MRDTTDAEHPLPVGAEAAVAIAELLPGGDLIWAAATEAEARRIAEALAVAAPDATVVLIPESDALPGAELPASPGNVGQRNAARATLAALPADTVTREANVPTATGATSVSGGTT